MDSQPSVETVFQALTALYHNPDTAGKERASIWLGELQKSVYAWQIADQLLRLNKDVESCYFAAQTMRTKIQYAFHELPVESHQSLRDSILEHVAKVTAETPAVIVTQLCLALADLALQMASWKGAASDLIEKFSSNADHMNFLLEVLKVLPEEISSRSLRLGANRRTEITQELTDSAPVVLQLLTACTEKCGQDVRIQAKVFRCLGSWFNINALPQEIIVNSKLLTAPFMALMNKDCPSTLHETACDCVCAALYAAEDIEKNGLLAQALFRGVMSLPEAYHMSVAEEDIDKSLNYCRIFTEMAESFLEVIARHPNQGLGDLRLVELVLTCVGHHQYEVAEITFNFWYRLSEILYKENNDELNAVFKPYIQRLIIALCTHCQMDPDHDGIQKGIDGDFREFRTRVMELIKDVVFLVGSSSCFSQMFEALKNQTAASSWEQSEAALFIMCAVAKNILPEEEGVVPQVLEAVLNLPPSAHVAVKHISVKLIGELSEWIDRHPSYLELVLQFLFTSLHDANLATATANSLQNICSTCRDKMGDHFGSLLEIVKAIDSFMVSKEAAVGLLKGTAMILAKMSHDKITEGLRQLCALQTDQLKELMMKDEQVKLSGRSRAEPTFWLDRLAAIFRNSNVTVMNGQQHPCKIVVEEVWPVLSMTCDKYQDDVRIIERCCRCIRFAVRCVGKASASLLTPLVTQMVNLYQVHQHSCFLYLGSILVDEYGMEKGCIQGLIDMLQAFCGPTFKLLEEQHGLRNHPDTVDDLFRLCTRFVQRNPVPFLQSDMMKSILCCAIAACSLDHRDANAAVMKFHIEFIKASRVNEDHENFAVRREATLKLLQEHGQALMTSLLNSSVFCLPSYMIVDIADVVFELMQVDRSSVCIWLEHALKSLPTQSSGGSVTATHKQLTDFHKAVTSAEDCKTVSHAFRDFSRLYR
ncbi:transportin-3-like isoform X2 [Tubulanus polymorphus]|uniref:transportin-3-like isoform X2 n=1 Tax=Tubulanus polymorphus TaxID=672921 RepID=UPI003DA1EC67